MPRTDGPKAVLRLHLASIEAPLTGFGTPLDHRASLTADVPVDHLLTHDDVSLDESSSIVRLSHLQEQTVEGSLSTLDELRPLVAAD
jgi:hypothetical protein